MSADPSPSYQELRAGNAVSRAAVADLTARLEWAVARIGDLEARLKQSSNKLVEPPSSDGLVKPAPKSLRGRSDRRPGRPAGDEGVTLGRVADPEVVLRHEPAVCAGCGDPLVGATTGVGVARRQVFDVPSRGCGWREHQIVTVTCGCGHHTTGAAPAEATAPAEYGRALAAIGVLPDCTGSSCRRRVPRTHTGTCSAPR